MMRLLNKKIFIKKPYITLLLDHHKEHTNRILPITKMSSIFFLDLYLILAFTIVHKQGNVF